MTSTLSETMRDLLEVFENADGGLMFNEYMVDLWREALTEGLEDAERLEATVMELCASDDGSDAYAAALARQQAKREVIGSRFTDEFAPNVIALPNARLPGEGAFG